MFGLHHTKIFMTFGKCSLELKQNNSGHVWIGGFVGLFLFVFPALRISTAEVLKVWLYNYYSYPYWNKNTLDCNTMLKILVDIGSCSCIVNGMTLLFKEFFSG